MLYVHGQLKVLIKELVLLFDTGMQYLPETNMTLADRVCLPSMFLLDCRATMAAIVVIQVFVFFCLSVSGM